MPRVYIGIGSNLGDREGLILRAIEQMRTFAHVRRVSALRETEPIGIVGQPGFLNAVAELETDRPPREVLEALLRIEKNLGRVRTTRWGPREIDLDLVAYGSEVVREADLEVPHARMHARRFVLEPLAELAPDWKHPVLGKTARELLGSLIRP